MAKWRKGQSGNPRGRPPLAQRWKRAIDAAMTEERVRELVEVILGAARQGEPWARRLVVDRVWPSAHHLEIEARKEVAPASAPKPMTPDRMKRIGGLLRSVGALDVADNDQAA